MKSLVRVLSVGLMSGVMSVAGFAGPPAAHADEAGFAINVLMMRSFPFANPGVAVAYGWTVCDRVRGQVSYADLMNQVRTELQTTEFLGGFLINQAVEELCPAQIWQLRESAAGYRPS